MGGGIPRRWLPLSVKPGNVNPEVVVSLIIKVPEFLILLTNFKVKQSQLATLLTGVGLPNRTNLKPLCTFQLKLAQTEWFYFCVRSTPEVQKYLLKIPHPKMGKESF